MRIVFSFHFFPPVKGTPSEADQSSRELVSTGSSFQQLCLQPAAACQPPGKEPEATPVQRFQLCAMDATVAYGLIFLFSLRLFRIFILPLILRRYTAAVVEGERAVSHAVWSNVIFKSPSGEEICAVARHATFGTITKVSGSLVNADPITAHVDLKNAHEVQGCVAYSKRGGAPFTKKARVAVAAGACACVVANHDKETVDMTFTDDGLPLEALNIPCVMISADIAEKLESCSSWQVTLAPILTSQYTVTLQSECTRALTF
jgi:hypothetical protein